MYICQDVDWHCRAYREGLQSNICGVLNNGSFFWRWAEGPVHSQQFGGDFYHIPNIWNHLDTSSCFYLKNKPKSAHTKLAKSQRMERGGQMFGPFQPGWEIFCSSNSEPAVFLWTHPTHYKLTPGKKGRWPGLCTHDAPWENNQHVPLTRFDFIACVRPFLRNSFPHSPPSRAREMQRSSCKSLNIHILILKVKWF